MADIKPLDLSREARTLDDSGTPAALIETARRRDDLVLLDTVDEALVLVDFPMGHLWRAQTGCARFVRLRQKMDGREYALVRRAARDRSAPRAKKQSRRSPRA